MIPGQRGLPETWEQAWETSLTSLTQTRLASARTLDPSWLWCGFWPASADGAESRSSFR